MTQYEIKLTNQFKKQLKKLKKQPNFDYNAIVGARRTVPNEIGENYNI